MKYASMSARTVGSAFSLRASAADVWRTNRWARPTAKRPISGICPTTSRVMRWKPRGRGGRVISLWNQLSNEYLYLSDEHLIVESALDLRRIGRLY